MVMKERDDYVGLMDREQSISVNEHKVEQLYLLKNVINCLKKPVSVLTEESSANIKPYIKEAITQIAEQVNKLEEILEAIDGIRD